MNSERKRRVIEHDIKFLAWEAGWLVMPLTEIKGHKERSRIGHI